MTRAIGPTPTRFALHLALLAVLGTSSLACGRDVAHAGEIESPSGPSGAPAEDPDCARFCRGHFASCVLGLQSPIDLCLAECGRQVAGLDPQLVDVDAVVDCLGATPCDQLIDVTMPLSRDRFSAALATCTARPAP